jgi:hypothetical protein
VGGRSIPGLLAAVLLAGAAACGGDAGDAAPTPSASPSRNRTITVSVAPLAPGVRLSFIQQRIDEGTRRTQVRVINGNADPVHVRSVGVDWAGYPLRLHRVDYDVGGQQIVDLRYFLPNADCSAAAGAAPMYGVAVTRARTLRSPMAADGRRFLSRIWKSECAARRIHQAVAVRYGDTWTVEGTGKKAVLHGSIVLDRRLGAEEVAVDQVQGSVLFDLALAGATTMRGEEPRASVPLDVTYGRCDEHARSQSTTSFTFRVWLRLAGSEPLAEVVEPTKTQQKRLLDFLDLACGDITSH